MKVKTNNTIQKISLLLLSCFLCFAAYSQTKEKSVKKIYLQAAAGGTSQNGFSGELGIQAILKSNWTATFSYHKIEMDPQNLPADYKEGVTILVFFPVYDEFPYNNMNLFSFTTGKFFETGRKTWFTTEAGFSIVNGEKVKFTSQPVVVSFLHTSSNYSFTKEKKTTFGGMLKADFNWAFLPYVGLGAGVFANFNSIQSPVGFQLKLTCGWMNNKKKTLKNQ